MNVESLGFGSRARGNEHGMNDVTATHMPTQLAFAPPIDAPGDKPGGEAAQANGEFAFFGNDGFTFLDFLDVINPLQHIPFVGTAYRELTGDTIDPGARIAGGTLFGGPIGAAVSVANVAIQYNTGKDMGEHVVALFEGDRADPDQDPAAQGPVETAHRDVQDHIDVLRWAERETAFHAAMEQSRQDPQRLAHAAKNSDPPSQPGTIVAAQRSNPALYALAQPATAAATQISQPSHTGTGVSPGAPAANGGWFSDTMLTALTRFQEAQQLSDLVASQKQ